MATTVAEIHNAQIVDCPRSDRERELAEVLSRYLPSFHRHAMRYLRNVADAEDAVQDALLSAYRHLDQFRSQARMSTWLTAIVINSARMKMRRRPRQLHVSVDEYPDGESYTPSETLRDPKLSPEEQCRRSELTERILKSAQQLSPILRRVFRLHHVDGLTTREIAELLGVAEGTVKIRVSRARVKLKKLVRKGIGSKAKRISSKVEHS